ncbi:uncharacterized protein LOC121866676 isoform X5 [Homarus americanus]|uniref:uncharacterized protein LOC121866676 isoform X5 n=1 Tax=Homarus americanus TaxID=6706 RepID=UPI001C46186C|nr:uncharacterized protein LOC121866676 isoform X5 [Homarus americanus]
MTKPCTRRQETQEVLNTTLLNLSRQDIARQELCTLPATQDIRRSELPAAGNTEAVLVMVMWPQHLHGDGRTVTTIVSRQQQPQSPVSTTITSINHNHQYQPQSPVSTTITSINHNHQYQPQSPAITIR